MKKGKAFEIETVRPGRTLYRIEPFLSVGLPQFTVATLVSHVVVSTAKTERGSCETYIFAGDGDGNILSWAELYGCSADVGHAAALAALGEGYEIIPFADEGECDDCDCSVYRATGGF